MTAKAQTVDSILTLAEAQVLLMACRFEYARYKDLSEQEKTGDVKALDRALGKLWDLRHVLMHPERAKDYGEKDYTLDDRDMRAVVVAAELELERYRAVPACRRTPDITALRTGHDKLCEAVHGADPKKCYYPESRGL